MKEMEKEILESYSKIKESYELNLNNINEIAKSIKEYNPDMFVICARGTSRNAGLYFKYLSEIKLGIPVVEFYPSVLTIYKSMLKGSRPIYIFFSQGGKGADLKLIHDECVKNNFKTLAITNNGDNPLYNNSTYRINMNLELEKAMAATKSFTGEMFYSLALINKLSDNKDPKEALDAIKYVLDNKKDEIKNLAVKIAPLNTVYILGRDYDYPITRELVCKLQETCFINAISYATSDFYHGPLALSDNAFNSLVFLSKDIDGICELIKRFDNNKSNTYIISSDNSFVHDNTIYTKKFSDEVQPFVNALISQLLALYITDIKKTDPDHSRNLSKYTITI